MSVLANFPTECRSC